MAKTASIRWRKGNKLLKQALDRGASQANIDRHMGIATERAALIVLDAMRNEIRAGKYAANAELTIAIKGSDKPLVGPSPSGQTFQGLGFEMVGPTTAFIGINRKDPKYDIARAVHDGVTIKVSDKMRNLFKILWMKSMGANVDLTGRAAELWELKPGGWLPLKDSTTAIVIPSRPFIERVLKRRSIRKQVVDQWEQAMATIFREIAAGAK